MTPNIDFILEKFRNFFPFNLLEDDEVTDCLNSFEFLECSPGTRIFTRDEKADHLFYILEGAVQIRGDRKQAVVSNAELGPGDRFGEEAIRRGASRRTDAVSVTATSLILIKHRDLLLLQNKYPLLRDTFSVFAQSQKVASDLVLPWLVPGEKIQLISRRHKIIPFLRMMVINLVGLVAFSLLLFASFSSKDFNQLLMVMAFLVLLMGILAGFWAAVEWANDYFIVTNFRVVAQRQLYGFFDSRQESPVSAILSTGFDTSLVGRLIGYGTVNLRSYTGEIAFRKLPFPQSIFDYLEHLREQVSREKKEEERKSIEATLTGRISGAKGDKKSKNQTVTQPAAVSSIYQSSSSMDWLARFFQLRQVKGNSIIYRTHWWILMKKTFVPFLLLVVLFIGFIGRVMGLFTSIPETPFYAATLGLTIVSALWWLYQYLDWYNDQYILTKDQLMDVSRKPLGYEDRRSAPVKNIQTVEFKRKGLIGLLLNYGTVRIQIGNEELTFDDVYAPSQIQAEVYLHLKKYQDEQQRAEGQRMAEWITTYDQIKRSQDDGNSEHR